MSEITLKKRKIVVQVCGDCPYHDSGDFTLVDGEHMHNKHVPWCTNGRSHYTYVQPNQTPPTWCPLRTSFEVIRLAKEVL